MGKDRKDISTETWRRKIRKRVASTADSKCKGPEGEAHLVFGECGRGPCAWNRDVEGDSGQR